MTNIESHKSVAIELPTYRVLKKVAEAEFRTPSKQIAFLLNRDYPELFADIHNGYDSMDEEDTMVRTNLGNVVAFAPEACETHRTQFRTWQVLVCLYKNRSIGPLSTSQIASAINYTNRGNLASSLNAPRNYGLVASRPIQMGGRDQEWLLTDFGMFIAKDLDEHIPIRLTQTILGQYERKFLEQAS